MREIRRNASVKSDNLISNEDLYLPHRHALMRTRIAGSSRAQVFLVSDNSVSPEVDTLRAWHSIVPTFVEIHIPIPIIGQLFSLQHVQAIIAD